MKKSPKPAYDIAANKSVRSPSDLGAMLRDVRESLDLTQSQAGKPVSIGQARVSEIERGSTGIQVGTLFRLLSSLGLEVLIRRKQRDEKTREEDKW